MPIHDWARVDAGIFHAFHHGWVEEIARALNRGILPSDHYALPEQHAVGYGPDVLTLQLERGGSTESPFADGGPIAIAEPKIKPTAETDLEFYLRKQNVIAVRHVTGDGLVAVVEIVSSGNKSSRGRLEAFLRKTAELLSQGIHLLIVDLHRPTKRDPHGIHSEIWEYVSGADYRPPEDKSLTLAAYEVDLAVRAYVQPVEIGDALPEMPLFLVPRGCVQVPLDQTYSAAFEAMPARWRRVLEMPAH
jgi:hypothetical protein